MISCSVIPQILNKQGELVDSKLFTDLLVYTKNNREEAKRYYIFAKSNIESFTLDNLGEPKINDLTWFVNKITKEDSHFTDVQQLVDLFPSADAKEALQVVIDNSNSLFIKEMASLLQDNISNLPSTNFSVDFDNTEKGKDWLGRYYPDNANVYLNAANVNKVNINKEEFYSTIVHEYIHAFTLSALNNPKTEDELKFSRQIEQAYNAFKRTSDATQYGFTNQYEFVAELMSNEVFLRSLGTKNQSILQKITNAIKEFLGIKTDNQKVVDNLIWDVALFIQESSPKLIFGGLKVLNKNKEGVISEINSYASDRITSQGHIKPTERFLLQVHKKVKYQIGKINNKVAEVNKQLKALELEYKKDSRTLYQVEEQTSPLFKQLEDKYNQDKAVIEAELGILLTRKTELASQLTDLETSEDINTDKAKYINLAINELDAISNRINTYDLDTKEGQTQLAEDYLFTRLINKTPDIVALQQTASDLSTKLLENISTYISTISEAYLNTDGLGEAIKIDINSILETNDDIIALGKAFEGFGDYPRLEAQLIHNITMEGKEKARLESLKVGKDILEHIKGLETWAKRNRFTNIVGKGKVRVAYAALVEVNHLDRLDLVKPFTVGYYRDINKYFKEAYDPVNKDTPKSNLAKKWLKDNYYTKPTSGIYINKSYTYIQNQPELKSFYEFFKQTMKDNYSKLPDYINLKNEEKIPTMIKNSFWEFFSMRKGNIMRSTLTALKTVLIGQGRAEFYDEAGNPKEKFELAELSQDEMKLRMIGEVRSDIKSFDLGHVLFEFSSFVNDYSEMESVLPKVRMIQNIVETKEYVSTKKNGIFGLKKETIAGGQSRMYDAINLYIDGKIRNKEESPKWRLGGGDLVNNAGEVVGRKSYYLSDMIRSLIRYTRALQLGFNPFSGINNILAGLMGDIIEASGNKFFNKKQLMQAISIYTSNTLTKGVESIKGDESTTKLALLSEFLQPLEEIGEWQDKRKLSLGPTTLVGKGVEAFTSKAFIFQEAGEDFVQKITMIAYLLNKKTPEGSSYWSMIEVENGKLKYKTEDNFDTEAEILKSRNTILDINHTIHGNYSKDNSSVYDGTLLFDSGLVFKKWLPYMIRNRFMAKRYNFRTGRTDEGFYFSGAKGIAKSINNMSKYFQRQFTNSARLLQSNKPLTPEEIVGIKKLVMEMIMFLTAATVSKILMPPPDDDKNVPWIPDFWEHLNISMWDSKSDFESVEGATKIFLKSMVDSSKRLSSEAVQMYQPSFYVDAVAKWALYGTLSEAWDVLRETFKFVSLDANDPQLRYKKGVHKGELKVIKETTDMIPYYKQIERAKNNGKKTVEELAK